MADKLFFDTNGQVVFQKEETSEKLYFFSDGTIIWQAGSGESPTAPFWMSWFD